VRILVPLIAALLTATPLTAAVKTPFFTETIDPGGFVGTHIHIAVDDSGTPHVVYWDISNQFLMYATRKNGAWSTEVIDAAGFVGTDTDIAIDAQGVPHVSFHNFTLGPDELRYGVRTGPGTWAVEDVDPTVSDVGLGNAIAVDVQGRPHISYHLGTGGLKYAVKNGGWSIEQVTFVISSGQFSDIALDLSGRPHISYYDGFFGDAVYSQKVGSSWFTTVLGAANADYTGVALDAAGNPHLAITSGGFLSIETRDGGTFGSIQVVGNSTAVYNGALIVDSEGFVHLFYQQVFGGTNDLWYAVGRDTGWTEEAAATGGTAIDLGFHNDIALDPFGNPVGVYYDQTNGDAMYIDAGVRLSSALSGVTWPVGGERTVNWRGAGTVDLLLSTDGGASYDVLASGLTGGDDAGGGQYTFTVPHQPSRFCKIKLERVIPYAATLSDSLFTIETDIALLNFVITLPGGSSGADLSWATRPGPADLAGYRIDRRRESADWSTLVSLTRETTYNDATGRSGDEYRLFAVNGLGHEMLLGSGSSGRTPSINALDVFPNPFSSGDLSVVFATAGGLGGGNGTATVAIYDVAGRLVRTLAAGSYPSGVQRATWNGRDARGTLVSSGVYFVRSAAGAEVHSRKVLVVR